MESIFSNLKHPEYFVRYLAEADWEHIISKVCKKKHTKKTQQNKHTSMRDVAQDVSPTATHFMK